MKKIIINSILIFLILFASSGSKLTTSTSNLTNTISLAEEQDIPYFENVVLITWDGTNAEWFSRLTNNGTLEYSKRILDSGFEKLVRVTSQQTSTNPGLATLETGYSPEIHTVDDNYFSSLTTKKSVPKGLTTFERLKASFGSDIQIAAFYPWGNSQFDYTYLNLNPNHWDPVFFNVGRGTDVDYWFGAENLSFVPGDPETNDAVIFPFNEATQKYPHYILRDEYMGNKAAAWLANNTDERFYLRVHLTEVDQVGGSDGVTIKEWINEVTPEYMEALVVADRATGAIYDVLESAGILNKTLFIIGTDHGMHYKSHGGEPWPARDWARSEMTFLFSNSSVQHSLGDIPITQKSISPTILASMGVDLSSLSPAYVGDDNTGVPMWEYSDTEIPTIYSVTYQRDDGELKELKDGSRTGDLFNITINMLEWCTDIEATLAIDGVVFDADVTASDLCRWINVDTSEMSGGGKTFLFTITDTFGNTATLEINRVKAAPLSLWISITGLLVLSSIVYIRKRSN